MPPLYGSIMWAATLRGGHQLFQSPFSKKNILYKIDKMIVLDNPALAVMRNAN